MEIDRCTDDREPYNVRKSCSPMVLNAHYRVSRPGNKPAHGSLTDFRFTIYKINGVFFQTFVLEQVRWDRNGPNIR